MILHFSYEEIRALEAGARALLEGEETDPCVVLAPPVERAHVEAFLPRLEGDISLTTLEELQAVSGAIDAIVECLHVEMEATVVATHPADEHAVAAYFEFAHALGVSRRVGEMASEMEALIEVVTGSPVTAETAHSFRFPD